MLCYLIFVELVFNLFPSAESAESDFTLEPILVKASSSFESLSEGDFLPKKKISFEASRSTTLETLDQMTPFPSLNYGYPSGAMGNLMGGRSIEDSQVSTLGVPLGLPQGGGPDLSFFPSYLWSGVQIGTVPSIAGFSPQGVSGSIDLDLWTRTQVRELKRSTQKSRITSNLDRNLQTVSAGTKVNEIAILGGMNQGRQKGPSGSLSYYFIRKPRSHFIFHLLGTDQDGESPGDRLNPSPNARKKAWRIIPALESHQEWGDDESTLIWEGTFYADLHQMSFEDPGLYSTKTRSQQYGIENALHWNQWTLALSGRVVEFQSGSFGNFSEFPWVTQISRQIDLDQGWKLIPSLGGSGLASVGFAPTARLSAEKAWEHTQRSFIQLSSLVKLPTLNARYYVLGSYRGNPNLKEERVHSLVTGHEVQTTAVRSVTSIKTEFRNGIQVNQNNTTENAGNALLVSGEEDLRWSLTKFYTLQSGLLLTYSQLADSKYPYPDLPYFSGWLGSQFTWGDHWVLLHHLRYMGTSTAAGGAFHPDYLLMNLSAQWSPTPGFIVHAGIDNLENKKAEVVLNYPLPGRMLFLNLNYQW